MAAFTSTLSTASGEASRARRARSLALGLGLGACLMGALVPAASAQQAQGPITLTNGSPAPLVVDGVEVEKFPARIDLESTVCVANKQPYKEGERWTFQKWSHGPKDECVTLQKAGTYKAEFAHEVLVHIKSAATSEQRSLWVPHGKPTKVEVPETVEAGEGDTQGKTRYRFQQWSEGETPFLAKNTITPLKTTSLEVKWVKEHLVTVESPEYAPVLGGGWREDGSSLVLLASDPVAIEGKDERWKFGRWESVGLPVAVIPGADKPQTTIKVDAPYTVRAGYEKQFLVHAKGPAGTIKREWLKEGQEVVLETPPLIEVAPERERHLFKRWDGMEGLLSAKVSGTVDRPVVVNAVYDRQVMVKVDGPPGTTGSGWQSVGSIVTITAPESEAKGFGLKAAFERFSGHAVGKHRVELMVREPVTITAVYTTVPDFAVLGPLMGVFLVLALAYSAERWVPLLPRPLRDSRAATGLLAQRRQAGLAWGSLLARRRRTSGAV